VSVLVVSGTGTGVGKTVVTAAVASLASAAGRSVAVIKPVQTGLAPGEPGDAAQVARLAGLPDGCCHELVRFVAPLAPATAARAERRPPVDLDVVAATVRDLDARHDLVLVEGAGGLLVRLDDAGRTVADLAGDLRAPVLVVVSAHLGTLNHTALTLEALAARSLLCAGVVIGAWPSPPDTADLACRSNLLDLPVVSGRPLAGVLADRAAALDPPAFRAAASAGLAPDLGGRFDAADFAGTHGPSTGA
jgi:dethiobiotin synthetase